ncbi:MAG: hypothetical protein AB4050_05220 [Synechococcus sp.]
MVHDATVELRLSSKLYERAKAVSEMRGESIEQLICNALEDVVSASDSQRVTVQAEGVRAGISAEQHHYIDESGHLLEGIETNLRPLPLPGCVAAFEGTIAEIVDFLNDFEHLGVTCNDIQDWMARHNEEAWESAHYLVMRTHKKRGDAFLYVLEIRHCELTH